MGRKIVIASTGRETLICVDGKVYSEHIDRIKFTHTGGEMAEISLAVDKLPLEGEPVDEKFRNFLNNLLNTAPDIVQEQCIEQVFKGLV